MVFTMSNPRKCGIRGVAINCREGAHVLVLAVDHRSQFAIIIIPEISPSLVQTTLNYVDVEKS